jgi:argininosuccinate lyase
MGRTDALWAGGFAGPPDPGMWAYAWSLPVDRRLWPQDVAGSRAHVRALVRAGVLTGDEGERLLDGLAKVAAELAGGSFAWLDSDEDVHAAVERRLTELVGPLGGKLHTGRSRNDQVATDLALWLKGAHAAAVAACAELIGALATAGGAHAGVVLPGLTHLQPAQPVLWGFQLAAHGFALARDADRFRDAAARADRSPLGAGAVAGSSFPLDPAETARDLGFSRAFDNAMDTTSDRDAVAEFEAAAAIAMVHASRLAEDVALWAGRGWVRLPDAWATGSSMLPQKRNPDVAELARGRAGTVIGRLTGLLATLKGLPLAYARDLQEDKAGAFEVADTLTSTMAALPTPPSARRSGSPPAGAPASPTWTSATCSPSTRHWWRSTAPCSTWTGAWPPRQPPVRPTPPGSPSSSGRWRRSPPPPAPGRPTTVHTSTWAIPDPV